MMPGLDDFFFMRQNQQKLSFILVYALLLVALFTVLTFGFSRVFLKEISSTTDITAAQQAFYDAESQAEQELYNGSPETDFNTFQISLVKGQEFEIDLFTDDGASITPNQSSITTINLQSQAGKLIQIRYRLWPNREGCVHIMNPDRTIECKDISGPDGDPDGVIDSYDWFFADLTQDVRGEGDDRTFSAGDLDLSSVCTQDLFPEPENPGDENRWFPIDNVNDCNFAIKFSVREPDVVTATASGGVFPYLYRIRTQGSVGDISQAVEVIYSTAPQSPVSF